MEEITYLLLTITIEAPVALIFLRKEKLAQVLFIVFCVNLITHPLGWQLIAHGANWWFVEFCIAFFEGIVFYLFLPNHKWRAALGAVSMNVVSALVGMIV